MTPQEQLRGICRVAAKVWQVAGEADILCIDQEAAQQMDDMLWTFQAGAFVPHGLSNQEAVRIHTVQSCPESCNVLILCGLWNLPSPLPSCARLVDFIPAEVSAKESARTRYKQLKKIGYTLQVHSLEA
jgi:DNA polymerase-3 subunit chi